jgi:hypothetical protein
MLDRPHSRQQIEARRARDRRYRQRLRANRIVVQVEIDCAITDMLIKLGWIAEVQLVDKRAIGAAIGSLLAASSKL